MFIHSNDQGTLSQYGSWREMVMLKVMQCLFILTLVSVAAGCAKTPQAKPQAETSPAFSVTAPINKAKQTAIDVRQKGKERELLDPQAQPEPSPEAK